MSGNHVCCGRAIVFSEFLFYLNSNNLLRTFICKKSAVITGFYGSAYLERDCPVCCDMIAVKQMCSGKRVVKLFYTRTSGAGERSWIISLVIVTVIALTFMGGLSASASVGHDDNSALISDINVQTPTSTPDPLQAASALIPVVSNANWTAVERDFDGVTMVLVPVGSFLMGSTEEEIASAAAFCNEIAPFDQCVAAYFSDEESWFGDNTQVIGAPYWIGKFEVTREQYQACVAVGVCSPVPESIYSTESDQPINRVTWFDAQTYCNWTGGRLPTEAEWEYAARGPDRLVYPWGNTLTGKEANHCDRNCIEADWASEFSPMNWEADDGYAVTAPVGSYPLDSSWVGAMDMAGNVWEWTSSLYHQYPYDANDGREADLGQSIFYPDTEIYVTRTFRGSSFVSRVYQLRAAVRLAFYPGWETHYGGFRCARVYEAP